MQEKRNGLPKILLTSVIKPLGPKYGDAESVGYELLHAQITKSQGVFSPRALHKQFSLDYLAENIENPATVLHYPSKKDLVKELEKGYQYVGISFINATYHKMKITANIIRKHSPQSRIILGGYGTSLPDKALKPWCDYISRGEGVENLRKILKNPPKKPPYKHPLVGSKLKIFSKETSYTGMIFAGLGCPNGCDFCSTSHYFNRRHIKLLQSGADIYSEIKRHLKINPEAQFTIIDEDFLLDRKRAMEFRDCVVHGGIPLSIFVFASIKALSMYKTEDLLEMGIDGVWIGYEGERAGYAKRDGVSPGEIFNKLHRNGILILSSMIIGFDYQNREVIEREFENLMSLEPEFAQFLIYNPIAGTPLYMNSLKNSAMRKEYLSDEELRWKMATGFKSIIEHPNMSAEELENVQKRCFEKDYQIQGPSIYRVVKTMLRGYITHKDSTNSILRKKALRFATEIKKAYPILTAGKILAPNKKTRKDISLLTGQIYKTFGKPSLLQNLASLLIFFFIGWTAVKIKLNLFQHPKTSRKTWRIPPPQFSLSFLTEKFKSQETFLVSVYENCFKEKIIIRAEGVLDRERVRHFVTEIKNVSLERRGKILLDFSKLKIDSKCYTFLKELLVEFRLKLKIFFPARARLFLWFSFLFRVH